jgi:hypothetical protein
VQQSLQPGEDATQIVADSGEDDVCSVTLTAFEMATTEVTVGLHMADHGLDCRATSEFALDGAEDAALPLGHYSITSQQTDKGEQGDGSTASPATYCPLRVNRVGLALRR